jgi:hypothetical protein
LPSSPCVRGAPRVVPVFGGERFLRPSCGAAQEVSASNFKIFWPSTNCPQFSGSYPPVSPDSPQEIHRCGPDGAGFSLSRRAASTRSAMRKEDRSARQEISRTAPRGSAERMEAGRLSGRSAGPRAHELGQAAEVSRSGARSAGRRQGLGWTHGGWPVKQEISRATRTSSAKPQSSADLAGDQPGTRGPGRMGRSGRSRTTGRTARGDAARGNPGRTKEEAPPRMRWRGPSDPAAPDTAISCSASVPLDQPPSRIPA